MKNYSDIIKTKCLSYCFDLEKNLVMENLKIIEQDGYYTIQKVSQNDSEYDKNPIMNISELLFNFYFRNYGDGNGNYHHVVCWNIYAYEDNYYLFRKIIERVADRDTESEDIKGILIDKSDIASYIMRFKHQILMKDKLHTQRVSESIKYLNDLFFINPI